MKTILYILLGISLTACLTEVDLSDLRESPRLVVNGVAVAGEPLRLSVTRTWFYTDDHPNVVIPDATVRLYVNDHYEETIPFSMRWVVIRPLLFLMFLIDFGWRSQRLAMRRFMRRR